MSQKKSNSWDTSNASPMAQEWSKHLSKTVRRQRKKLDLSQQDVADLCGLSNSWYAHIEAAQHLTTMRHICTLAEVLELPLEDMVPRSEPYVYASNGKTKSMEVEVVATRGTTETQIEDNPQALVALVLTQRLNEKVTGFADNSVSQREVREWAEALAASMAE